MLRDQSSNIIFAIFCSSVPIVADVGVGSIVFVHGLRGNGSASWCKATAPSATINSLLQQVPGTRVREYDSKKELHEEFDWESFLDIEASSLLKFLGLENSPDVRPGHYGICTQPTGLTLSSHSRILGPSSDHSHRTRLGREHHQICMSPQDGNTLTSLSAAVVDWRIYKRQSKSSLNSTFATTFWT